MNLYELYVKERENLTTIKTDKGFIMYRIDFPNCIINDYFVIKAYRRNDHGKFLANQVFEICKQAGVKTVFCQTDDLANNCDLSRYVIEKFGFEFVGKSGTINHFRMEVSEWEKR